MMHHQIKEIMETKNPTLIRGKKITNEILFKLLSAKNDADLLKEYEWLFNKIIEYADDEVDIYMEQL